MRRAIAWAVAILGMATLTARAAGLDWPATDVARHAQAWFAMLTADDAAARQFFAEHFAPLALAEAAIDERLQRRRGMLARTQGLTPLEVLDDRPLLLAVRCRAGNGDNVVATFDAEAESPHRLVGVRLDASPSDTGPPGATPAPGTPPDRLQRPSRPAPEPPGPPLDDAAAVKELRAQLDAHAAAGEFSGVALLAREGKPLLAGGWGMADRAHGTINTLATRFNVGSIGKLFTRAAVAQLAEQGKLSLDDKLSRWLPDFPHADSITIDMLCEHTSGVGDFFNDAYHAMDRSQLRHNHDYLALIHDQPLWFAPGTSKRYSNGGYALLGEVIGKASGEDYYEYLAKHVFAPAGMEHTGAPIEGDGTPDLAHGYTTQGAAPDSERDNVATRPARGSAAGGSYATAGDLLLFDRALESAKLCGLAWSRWVTGDPRPDRGGAAAAASAIPPSFGFAGGAPGIAADWMREGDVTLIVLTNRDPETAQKTLRDVRPILRRMQPTTRKAGI